MVYTDTRQLAGMKWIVHVEQLFWDVRSSFFQPARKFIENSPCS
jgi:hypothetical protein